MAKFISLTLLFVLAAFSFAQEAQISFAEGGEFALSSGGKRTSYRADKLNAEALSLRNEDILQTGAGSFVELRLEPSGTRIKVAENTSLVCKGQGPEDNSLCFALLYGRIRLSTVGGWSPDTGTPVFIDAGQAEAVFRQGDAGVDYLYTASPSPLGKMEPVMCIYGFSGSIEIIPASSANFESQPRLPVTNYESVIIEAMNPSFSFIERKPVEDGIIQYWNRHNFSGSSRLLNHRSPPAAAALPATPVPARDADWQIDSTQYTYPEITGNNNLKKLKNGMLISGVVLFAGSIGMQVAGQQRWNGISGGLGDALVNYGYLQLGLGFSLGAASLFVNQQQPKSNAAK